MWKKNQCSHQKISSVNVLFRSHGWSMCVWWWGYSICRGKCSIFFKIYYPWFTMALTQVRMFYNNSSCWAAEAAQVTSIKQDVRKLKSAKFGQAYKKLFRTKILHRYTMKMYAITYVMTLIWHHRYWKLFRKTWLKFTLFDFEYNISYFMKKKVYSLIDNVRRWESSNIIYGWTIVRSMNSIHEILRILMVWQENYMHSRVKFTTISIKKQGI
jgi:hypothetical protein